MNIAWWHGVSAPTAPAAEIAARAGHSMRVLLTIYAHCIPGCDQISSQQIEQALSPSQWPPAGPQEPAQTPGIASAICPCHSWTQRDTAGPDTTGTTNETSLTCGNAARGDWLHGSRPRTADPGAPVPQAADQGRSGPQLAHRNRERSAEPLPDTHQTRQPGISALGLTWGFGWQVLGSNQRRLSRRFYMTAHSYPSE
jgi:hypothetical protein